MMRISAWVTACLATAAHGQCDLVSIGTISTSDYPGRPAVRDHYVYVPAQTAFKIYDASDATRLVEVGSVSTIWARDVAVSGDFAYVADEDEEQGLLIIDVSDPGDPVVTGSISFGCCASYVDVIPESGVALVGALQGGVQIVDVSDPTAPAIISTIPGYAGKILVSGTTAYTYVNGLRVFDLTDPARPVELGSLGGLPIVQMDLVDDLLFVAAQTSGLVILDVSDPSNPSIMSSLPTPGGNVFGVVAAPGRVYLTDFAFEHAVFAIDVVDPTQPEIIGANDTLHFALGIARLANTVFVSHTTGGGLLQAVDISTCSTACDADLNGDGSVGVSDLIAVIGGWGTDAGDVTGDGTTDVADLIALIGAWGTCE